MATPEPIDRRPKASRQATERTQRWPAELLAILSAIERGERFLVCSHSRPDGDAVGSMLAMGMLLRQMGKRADLVAADRIPAIYRGLPGADQIHVMMRVHGPYDAAHSAGMRRT